MSKPGMKISKSDILPLLTQFNPWWKSEGILDLPKWRRSAFNELLMWTATPPVHRAIMISGARQVGKTTLLLQTIDQLLKDGVSPNNILYITFDHPILKIAGLQLILEAWREFEPKSDGIEYLFLDEAQVVKDFGTWVKHQVDFSKNRRIIFTGSAMSLADIDQESGVGRWHTMRISTLSFYEYIQIKNIKTPTIPDINSLSDLFKCSTRELLAISNASQALIGHFHEFLVRGGFPQTALVENVPQAQRLLREDIIDKVLKRDMTALFGIRRVFELEQLFIYLCLHDGGIQDIQSLSSNLGVNRATVQNYINLLESTHLLYRLPPYGLGKEVLRARYKLYMVDPAIAPAILMKGKTILEDPTTLGKTVETAVCGHLFSHSRFTQSKFSYWKDPNDKEVDLIYEAPDRILPFEVKYTSKKTDLREIQGLVNFAGAKSILNCFVLTKEHDDIGLILDAKHSPSSQFMRIPTPIFCYWLGKAELNQQNLLI